jgi:hypothetical protein
LCGNKYTFIYLFIKNIALYIGKINVSTSVRVEGENLSYVRVTESEIIEREFLHSVFFSLKNISSFPLFAAQTKRIQMQIRTVYEEYYSASEKCPNLPPEAGGSGGGGFAASPILQPRSRVCVRHLRQSAGQI